MDREPDRPAAGGAAAPRAGARTLLLGAFFVSGAAGLSYELVWSRYLALLLGHSAYAQVVVIAVYLGGMALGALAIGQRAPRIRRPLVCYAWAEIGLAAIGILFHPVFVGVSDLAWEVLLPGVPGALGLAVPWVLSVLLLLPPSVLLGATFPLMTGGLLRGFRRGEGRTVADAYLWNSLGGAVGILTAGFVLVPLLGTVGALASAAAGNLAAAAVALLVARRHPTEPDVPMPGSLPAGEPKATVIPVPETPLERVLPFVLGASFLTAVASFIYEIGWIRMLSLVMGSATHSFELMLSAFILGLAGGSWLIRERVDRSEAPVRLLGVVQWLMGFAALATLPLYAASFGFMASAIQALPSDGSGYVAFNLARYGIALLIMLPSTIMAGATLPLLTAILLRRDRSSAGGGAPGERAVGQVYALNTFGSVSGVIAAGLILLPLLGLKGMLVAGAALDMVLGAALLLWSRVGGEGTRRVLPAGAAGAAVLAAVGALALVHLDQAVLTGGVFRHGRLPEAEREVLFYEDGRTATVGVHVLADARHVVLTTNGKPDASLPLRWIAAAMGEEVAPEPLTAFDAATQTVSALTLLAHRPGARTALNIGHGSGMSVDALLTSPTLESVVTAEIEPAVVRGSHSFLPANAGPFEDPRHAFVLDDARSYLARSGRRFDLLLSEPSNPWVSGTASLFTEEFYRRVRQHLAPGGVFGQWIQLYEMDDGLVLSVLAAVHEVFPAWRAYMVGAGDLLIVAGEGELTPDWSVFSTSAARERLDHLPPFAPVHLESLSVFRRADLAPLLEAGDIPRNSDFRPVLESGAERARYEDRTAQGVHGLGLDRFRVLAATRGERRPLPERYRPPPIWVLQPMQEGALAAWIGEIQRGERPLEEPPFEEWSRPYLEYLLLLERMDRDITPPSWPTWIGEFTRVEATLHAGTAGWADEGFYATVRAYLDRVDAPAVVRAAVDFSHGLAAWDFAEAAGAADRLRELRGPLGPLVGPGLLLDGGVTAYLEEGRVGDAAELHRELAPRAGRPPGDLRNRFLAALIERAAGS